jgi:hypothetical protein
MQNILLPVDPETAQNYQAIDPETQQELLLFLAAELKRKLQIKKLHDSMDALSAEAQANGLTPEILESILAEEDDEENSN